MESVTLVLSGTLLALQYIGTRDKYLLAFIIGLGSYHDSELDIFLVFFFTKQHAVSLSINTTSSTLFVFSAKYSTDFSEATIKIQ